MARVLNIAIDIGEQNAEYKKKEHAKERANSKRTEVETFFRLIVASQKLDVFKTNICPRYSP